MSHLHGDLAARRREEDEASNRAGDKDAAFALRAHPTADLVNEVDRAGDVGIHDVTGFVEILVQKCLAETAAGVGEESCNRAPIDLAEELVGTLYGGKISLHHLDRPTVAAQLLRGAFN